VMTAVKLAVGARGIDGARHQARAGFP
jgi:hypothetical protein